MRKLNACSKCRAFFETTETVCPSCGTSIVPKMIREKGGIFDRLASRGFTAVNMLVGANILLFVIAAIIQGGLDMRGGPLSFGGLVSKTLWTLGAGDWHWAVEEGQWWRLVCPMFLHSNVIHIFFNMMVLRQVGPLVERTLGSSKFLSIYVLAGLGGSIAHAFWNRPFGWGIGASGAVFGVVGIVAVLALRAGNRDLAVAMIKWIAIMLLFGLMMPIISNEAHIGGLIVGGVAALRITDARSTRLRVAAVRRWDVAAVLSALLVLVSFGMVVVN